MLPFLLFFSDVAGVTRYAYGSAGTMNCLLARIRTWQIQLILRSGFIGGAVLSVVVVKNLALTKVHF
jgi:hypothetical protein